MIIDPQIMMPGTSLEPAWSQPGASLEPAWNLFLSGVCAPHHMKEGWKGGSRVANTCPRPPTTPTPPAPTQPTQHKQVPRTHPPLAGPPCPPTTSCLLMMPSLRWMPHWSFLVWSKWSTEVAMNGMNCIWASGGWAACSQ